MIRWFIYLYLFIYIKVGIIIFFINDCLKWVIYEIIFIKFKIWNYKYIKVKILNEYSFFIDNWNNESFCSCINWYFFVLFIFVKF